MFTFDTGKLKIDTDGIKEKTQNIFDNINTDVIDYDVIPEDLSDIIQ